MSFLPQNKYSLNLPEILEAGVEGFWGPGQCNLPLYLNTPWRCRRRPVLHSSILERGKDLFIVVQVGRRVVNGVSNQIILHDIRWDRTQPADSQCVNQWPSG